MKLHSSAGVVLFAVVVAFAAPVAALQFDGFGEDLTKGPKVELDDLRSSISFPISSTLHLQKAFTCFLHAALSCLLPVLVDKSDKNQYRMLRDWLLSSLTQKYGDQCGFEDQVMRDLLSLVETIGEFPDHGVVMTNLWHHNIEDDIEDGAEFEILSLI